jgi:1-acyl-sn-glycerol-3-phosphate acyltransferase
MTRYLPVPLAVAVVFLCKLVVLLFWVFVWLLPGVLLKLLLPSARLRRWLSRYLVWVASRWTASNALLYRLLLPRYRRVALPSDLDPARSYLLVCNHQSWADILILFDVFSGRVPWPRFFLKKELIWVPIIGPVCWALDFPFMQRHSQKAVAMNPQRARDDLETTRRFCERFRGEPITVVNFLDGTRFTEAKRIERKSPFKHLLRPKSAGLAFTLEAMGDQFAGVLDVTICYGRNSRRPLLDFLSGRLVDVTIEARVRAIDPAMMRGDYQGDAGFRKRFQSWVTQLWSEKDARLDQLHAEALRNAHAGLALRENEI